MLFDKFRRVRATPFPPIAPPAAPPRKDSGVTTKSAGDAGEDRALEHLLAARLRLVQRNYRTPGRGGGEVDLVMREPDGTVVFVEVRKRRSATHGGAAASVSVFKQRRIVFAARHWLMRHAGDRPPPCRFDVVTVEADRLDWIRGAFDAG